MECGDVGGVNVGVGFAELGMMAVFVDIGVGGDECEHERSVPMVLESEGGVCRVSSGEEEDSGD